MKILLNNSWKRKCLKVIFFFQKGFHYIVYICPVHYVLVVENFQLLSLEYRVNRNNKFPIMFLHSFNYVRFSHFLFCLFDRTHHLQNSLLFVTIWNKCNVITKLDSDSKRISKSFINFSIMKSSKKYFLSAFYLIMCLMKSLKNFEKIAIWKNESWFPYKGSKLTSARNMLDLPLKYWFMEAKVFFWICFGHKK